MLSEQPPSSSFFPPASTILEAYGSEADARIRSICFFMSVIRRYSGFPVSTLVQVT